MPWEIALLRDAEAVRTPFVIILARASAWSDSRRTLYSPHQGMRIENDHLSADQSEGGAAGSNGSSNLTTVPRMHPMKDR